MKTILVTGGCGFIGSHTVCELVQSNYNVIIIDNFINSDQSVINKMESIINTELTVYEFDIQDKDKLKYVFQNHTIDGVIHFAALKSVSESIKKPLEYYNNNITATLTLLEVMEEFNCKKIIFSSSATVYGSSKSPLDENSQIGIGITNPYGQTKYMMEQILNDYSKSNKDMQITILRYFNPVGAHPSGLIGENPNNIPSNLMPFILKVSIQNNYNILFDNVYKELKIFGNNYQTKDKTCIRDYIHVIDLAKGHISALNNSDSGYHVYNLGTGKGTTVLELIEYFEKTNNVKVPYKFVDRRDGDLEEVYCTSDKAYEELGWKTELTLEDICRDSWNYMITESPKLII
jgi:UDP-glucose 4-epimerase